MSIAKRSALLLLVSLASCAAHRAPLAEAAHATRGVSLPGPRMHWVIQTPGLPIKKAPLWGEPERTPFGELVLLPGGFDSGLHAHTGDYRAVVVAGTLFHIDQDGAGADLELPAGSYVLQPGKQMHIDRCKAGADCILFLYQTEKPDILWPEGEGR